MAEDAVVITIKYSSDIEITRSIPGTGEVERIGSTNVAEQVRTVVAGESIADYAIEQEIAHLHRFYKNVKILNVTRTDVSTIYFSPHHRI